MEKKDEYFQNISTYIHDTRIRKADWTAKELEIYHIGKKDAFREVLMLINMQHDEEKRTYIENMWGEHELKNMIEIYLKSLHDKLNLARRLYRKQQNQIETLSQVTLTNEHNIAKNTI